MPVGILGIEYHLPDRVETNEDLQRENPDWRMEELGAKLGIKSRRIAAQRKRHATWAMPQRKNCLNETLSRPKILTTSSSVHKAPITFSRARPVFYRMNSSWDDMSRHSTST